MNLKGLFEIQKKLNASDLLLKVGSPPMVRILGELAPLKMPALTKPELEKAIRSILSDSQKKEFEENLELDCSLSVPGIARYRVNIFQQKGTPACVFHYIPQVIPEIEELGLPTILKDLVMRPRGLLIVTGPSGSGKTSTQAAMIDYRNRNDTCHIVTVEDPIEYIHESKKALVNQREVGRDTNSFANALKYVLRQDPDVILVGEMRDLETISLAITAAETGHLVITTLHTTDSISTIDRIIDVFPPHQQNQIRMQLSLNLLAIISQMLLRRADKKGMILAYELLIATPPVRNLIREGKTYQLRSILQTSQRQGMVLLDAKIAELVKKNLVTLEEAKKKCISPEVLEEEIGAKVG
ncbi:type IV pili twitching motility protein PilT [candidate division WOR-3 bacterium]|uniref:Type IV pili twitching motility protein PilT n=1 Tax=candidate division WOR-3 bacterium TaxID=2052148 RepID=A0A660SDX7_UNCW3|nr:MAG: type IV pili twitching motility protein PilT [candidate division WOR-3 bacterium]